jgi:hypothetical protein
MYASGLGCVCGHAAVPGKAALYRRVDPRQQRRTADDVSDR